MKIRIGMLLAGIGLLIMAVPLRAHHSWAVEYDSKKPVKVTGVVTKFEWTNPHTHIYVDVKDASGTVTIWNFEMASTIALERNGWSRKSLPVGTEVTIGGFGGRAVTERAIANSVVTSDGKNLFVGSPTQ